MIEILYGVTAAAGVSVYVARGILGLRERRYLDARADRVARREHRESQSLPPASLGEFYEFREQLEKLRKVVNHCAMASGITGRPMPSAPDVISPLPQRKA
jgi:hypothetical protein